MNIINLDADPSFSYLPYHTDATGYHNFAKVEDTSRDLSNGVDITYNPDMNLKSLGEMLRPAVGKSGVDTYTISANDGLTKASDVKAYVDSSIENAKMTWSEWN